MLPLVFLAVILTSAFAFEKDGDVLVLTDDDIDDAIKSHPFILVEFYAPWCGHCKHLAPEYAKAATALAKLETPIPLAKVDATENTESASKYGVRGYPTLKWFSNGKESEYTGGRTEAEIVNWIKKKVGAPYKALAAASDVETFKESAEVVLIGFAAADSAEFKVLEDVGRSLEDVPVAIATDAAVASELSFAQPSVVLFKKFDEGRVDYTGAFDSEELLEFVKGNSLPLISTFSQESAPKLFGSSIQSHFLYFNAETADSHAGVLDALRPVATEFKGKTLFVFVPESEQRVWSYFGITEKDVPTAVLVAMGEGDMKKFGLTGELSTERVRAHVTAFHNGELKPTLKSEEIPADNNGPVVVVVGKSFNDVVMDPTKDALIEFYAPWCGHCKALAPVWEQLGQKFADSKNVVIGKVDATANDIDHPKVSIKGFPTILFFPANAKDTPVAYEGGRDLESLVSWVQEHATVDLTEKAVEAEAHSHKEL